MPIEDFHKKRKHTSAIIWAVALALTLVVFISFVWLAPTIWDVSETNKNVIPLFYSGDKQIYTQNTLQYITVEQKPGFSIEDEDATWEIKTDVDLFSSSYVGTNGEVTVESSNGDKVIAPGTSQEYRFSLKNTGNISLDYTMELASLFTIEEQSLPIKIRLRKGDEWVLGGENEWAKPEAIKAIIEEGTVSVNNSIEYVFEWLWLFEDEIDDSIDLNDIYDIFIAGSAAEQDVKIQLEISTVSKVTPGAIPVDENGLPLLEPLVRWNIISHTILPTLFLLLALQFIIAPIMPVAICGKLSLLTGEILKNLKIGKKTCFVRENGYYSFNIVRMGRHTISHGASKAEFKIKRKFRVKGIAFTTDKKGQVLLVGMNIRSIELNLFDDGKQLRISENSWQARDKKNRAYGPNTTAN